MNECFGYLEFKYPEKNFEKAELAELEKYLALQDNREYLTDAKAAVKMLYEYYLSNLSEKEINKILGLKEGEELR